MNQLITAIAFCLLTFTAYTQKIQYKVEMKNPHQHYYTVTMKIQGWKKNTIDVKMPVWAPGSYLIREFSKGVDYFTAQAGDKSLSYSKTDKSTWRVNNGTQTDFTITYQVYAFELSVRTSFLDASHGFISGTSVFMYVPELKNSGGVLDISLPIEFKRISCPLKQNSPTTFQFDNMDELYDSPIEIGNHIEFDFMSAGCKHRVAMYGEGNFDVEKLKTDMAKITDECTKVWGENPNKDYLFIIHNLTTGSGGLEHAASTTLQVSRNTYTGSGYMGFLSVVAHEYFHLWNVKRLRPTGLWPYDYDKENYTDLLWISEGFTSYYDELLLKRAGFYDEGGYVRSLNSTLASVENTPGSHVQSLAESSFDAWIKGYRPNENSNNKTISYYPKGALTGAMLDIEIIQSTNGKYKLDDLMKKLYTDFYKTKKTGFSFADFKAYTETICGKKMDDFFNTFVVTAGEIDYNKYLSKAGLQLSISERSKEATLGANTKDQGGKCMVTTVTDGSGAHKGGLNVNDEIIAINGLRIDQGSLQRTIASYPTGTTLEVLINRDNLIQTLKITVEKTLLKDYYISPDNNANKEAEELKKKWLN